MQGLLDFLKTPAGQGLLAAGLGAAANAGRGGTWNTIGRAGLGGLMAYGQAGEREAQLAQDAKRNELYGMQIEAYKADVARKNEALEAERRKRAALPTLFRQGGMTGGEAVPQTEAGVPFFSRPLQAAPMQMAPGGLDWMGALRAGYEPKEIQDLAGLVNIGKPKATRQVEVDDGKGGKRIALVDDYGQEVAGFTGYTAPVQVNQGDRVSFVKPAPGVALPVNMSPEARASNALGWANNALTRRGQDLTDARARETAGASRIPAGYRLAADGQGLEFIPGGPADPNAAKRAAPTEFQGKSAIYGTRAQEADKIIAELEGKYSPAAVNTKEALGNVPLIGGALEAGGNLILSDSGQKAEQAQRDFINAVLRQESGAVISKEEFANAKRQYFPQPGDSDAVKAQKAANRRLAIQGILNNARGTNEVAQPAATPSVDDLLKKYGGK